MVDGLLGIVKQDPRRRQKLLARVGVGESPGEAESSSDRLIAERPDPRA